MRFLPFIIFVVLLVEVSGRRRPKSKSKGDREVIRDGNCSPEIRKVVGAVTGAVGTFGQYAGMLQSLPEKYFGDDIPWKKLESFKFDSTKVCVMSCSNIRDKVKMGVTYLKMYMRSMMKKGKRLAKKKQFKLKKLRKDGDEEVRDQWDNLVFTASRKVVPVVDQLNYFTNKMQRDMKRLPTSTLADMSREVPCQLWKPDDMDTNMAFKLPMKMLLPSYVAKWQNQFISEAYNDWLMSKAKEMWEKWSKSESTLVKTLLTDLTKEEFLDMSQRVVDSLQLIAQSPDVGPGLMKVLEAVVDNLGNIDLNALAAVNGNAWMDLRTALMNTDVVKVLEAFEKVSESAQKSWWKFKTGDFPEMEKFIGKLLDTMLTDGFWARMQTHYDKVIAILKKMYEDREDDLKEWVSEEWRPLEKKAVEWVEKFANDIQPNFEKMTNEIKGADSSGALIEAFEGAIEKISSHLFNCYAMEKGVPKFLKGWFGLEDEKDSEIKKTLKDLFFKGWSDEDMSVKGMKEMGENIQKAAGVILSTAVGECPV